MGFQPFFRKPQLHRPCTPTLRQFPGRHQRASNFFEPQPQRVRPKPVFAEQPAPAAANPPLLPLAANLVTGAIAALSLTMLFVLLWRR